MISTLIRGSYNAYSRDNEHKKNQEENRINRKNSTGSKYKPRETTKKSKSSIKRTVRDIKTVFKNHQENFNDDIDILDKWRSSDFVCNTQSVLANKRLACKWKQQFDLKQKQLMRNFKNNDQRITNMTFNAHKKNISFRTLSSMRCTVSNL